MTSGVTGSPLDLVSATLGGLPLEYKLLELGHLLWILAYVFSLLKGLRDGRAALPLAAVLLNITWEFIFLSNCLPFRQPGLSSGIPFAICGIPLEGEWKLLLGATFALDALILLHAAWCGWRDWTRRGTLMIRLGWVALVAIGLVVAMNVHIFFMLQFLDFGGTLDAWVINLLMSLLFIGLALRREGGRGLSMTAAWTKLAGSALNAVALLLAVMPLRFPLPLMLALFGAVLLADLVYIALLARAQRRGLYWAL